MNVRIFISKPETGWEEIEIPEHFKRYSHDALIKVAYKFLGNYTYKGLLITENPNWKTFLRK